MFISSVILACLVLFHNLATQFYHSPTNLRFKVSLNQGTCYDPTIKEENPTVLSCVSKHFTSEYFSWKNSLTNLWSINFYDQCCLPRVNFMSAFNTSFIFFRSQHKRQHFLTAQRSLTSQEIRFLEFIRPTKPFKHFSICYANLEPITVFRRVQQLTTSLATLIQSIFSHVMTLKSVLILFPSVRFMSSLHFIFNIAVFIGDIFYNWAFIKYINLTFNLFIISLFKTCSFVFLSSSFYIQTSF